MLLTSYFSYFWKKNLERFGWFLAPLHQFAKFNDFIWLRLIFSHFLFLPWKLHNRYYHCLGFSRKQNELPSLLFEFMSYGSLDNILDINRTKNFTEGQFPKLTNVGFIMVSVKTKHSVQNLDVCPPNRLHCKSVFCKWKHDFPLSTFYW